MRCSRTEAPSLHRRYPASPVLQASPPPCAARPDPRGLSVGACHATGRASRVASVPLFHACCRHYPGGAGRCLRRSLPDPWQPSPLNRRVGFRIIGFEACTAFRTLRPAWSLSRPRRPFGVEVLQTMSLPPPSAPTVTGWSDSCRAGFAPAEEQRLFTAHVESTTGGGGGRRMGVAVPGGFRDAGASLPAVAPFPVAAHRTGRADFPQPALGRDHAFAHGKLVVRTARRVSPYSFQSRSSGNRTNCPDRTLCLRQSHWRSRRVACRSIAA